jgi:hypothetical protein
MNAQDKNTAQVAFGEYLRILRISKYINKRVDFARMIGMEPSLLKKIEDGNFKFDISIDLMWKIVIALRLNHTEVHNFMLAGNRSPLRDLGQELLIRQHIEYNEVWVFSGHVLYDEDIIARIASDLKSGISYSVFASETYFILIGSKIERLVPLEQRRYFKNLEISEAQYLSEFMAYLHHGRIVAMVDLVRDNHSASFLTNVDNSTMFRRKDILEDHIFAQGRQT